MTKEPLDIIIETAQFYKLNNPKQIKDRVQIVQSLGDTPLVFTPSIAGQIISTALSIGELDTSEPLEGIIEISFSGKTAKSRFDEYDLSILSVVYKSATVGEIFESGVADTVTIKLHTKDTNELIGYYFERMDNMYVPKLHEGFSLYPTALFSYYSKEISTLSDS